MAHAVVQSWQSVLLLVDYLEGGDGLDLFLDQYPTVKREQAEAAVAIMRQALSSA